MFNEVRLLALNKCVSDVQANEPRLLEQLKKYAAEKNYRQFRSDVYPNIIKYCGYGSTPEERAYVYLSLWLLYYNGRLTPVYEAPGAIGKGKYQEIANIYFCWSEAERTYKLKENNMNETTKDNVNPNVNTKATIKIEAVTLVNGADAAKMTDEQYIALIRSAEASIGALKSIGVDSTRIKAKIAEQEAALAELVKLYDAK